MSRILIPAVLVFALAWRFYVAFHYQTRICIDEIWYFLNPAYKLAFGLGAVIDEPDQNGMRGFLLPLILAGYLKFLAFFGVKRGPEALAWVRGGFAAFSVFGLVVYARLLASRFGLKVKAFGLPLMPVLVLFFIPEIVHASMTAELNMVALPVLLSGISLLAVERPRQEKALGWFLLFFSVLFRIQFGVYVACHGIWLMARKRWRELGGFALCGLVVVAADIAFESWMYGRFVFPAFNYFYAHSVEKLADRYGTAPFHIAFEYLWRVMSEPVFALTIFTLPSAYRMMPFLTAANIAFVAIHCLSGHKELRFFYAPAVIFAGLASASAQAWLESMKRNFRIRLAAGVGIAGLCFGAFLWRAQTRVAWEEYSIPGRLEAFAGAQPDARGLITYGWGGIYHGGNYTFYNPGNYVFTQTLSELKGRKLDAANFNYLVVGEVERTPCREVILALGGAVLYRCTTDQMKELLN